MDAGSLTEAQVEELLKEVRKRGRNSNTARSSRSRKEAEVGKQDNLVVTDKFIDNRVVEAPKKGAKKGALYRRLRRHLRRLYIVNAVLEASGWQDLLL